MVLTIAEDFKSLTHLIELELVDLHVGRITHRVAPHRKRSELAHDGLVCGVTRDLQNFVVVTRTFKNTHFIL